MVYCYVRNYYCHLITTAQHCAGRNLQRFWKQWEGNGHSDNFTQIPLFYEKLRMVSNSIREERSILIFK